MSRLTYSLIFVLFLSTIGLSWLLDNLYQFTETEKQDIDKVKLFEQLGENIALSIKTLENAEPFIKQWQANHQYQLNQHPLAELALPDSLLNEIKSQHFLLLTTDSQLSYYYLISDQQVIELSAPITLFDPSIDNRHYFYTALFYLLLLLAFLAWAYPLLKQLNRLQSAAKAFGAGKLSKRVQLHPLSYVSEIEQEFNHMAQRIEDLISDVKLLGNAVSHELRTPLARIRFGLDTLAEEDDPKQRQHYQAKINENLDEMTQLVESLLSYARLEQTMVNLSFQKVDVIALINNVIQSYQNEATAITFSPSISQAFINGDERFLTILLNNLVTNALRYGNGRAYIELAKSSHKLIISIHDDGSGIPENEQANIFKPFIRAAGKKSQGFGLGLAIAKRIVDWHKGQITVSSSKQLTGAQFNITFPSK